jgi:protein O-mannosyl-transferase
MLMSEHPLPKENRALHSSGNVFTMSPRSALATLLLVVLVIYLPGLGAPFIFDDFLNLVHNPQIQTLTPQQSSWFESRPVGFMSFALNYAVHGLWPVGFRAVNVCIHILSVLVLYRLIYETALRAKPLWEATRTQRLAFVAAMIWGIHPLQTAAVSCIVQRFESLMGLCFFLVLYTLHQSCTRERAMAWRCAAVVCFWIGLGCKEVMVACLPVALLYDRYFLADSWRTVWRQRGWVYAGMAGSFVWLGWVVSHAYANGANATAGFGLQGISSWEYFRSQPAVIFHYLRLFVWPDQFCIDYGWPVENNPWKIYGLGLLLAIGFIAGCWGVWKKQPWGFLVLSVFLVLAPTSSIMPIADLAFEHRLYVPLAGLALLLAMLIDFVYEYRVERSSSRWALLLIVVALSVRTVARNREYVDPEIVWRQAIAQNPQHARAHFLLAEHLVRMQRYEQSLPEYAAAYHIRPHYIAALNNAALTLERLHRPEKAFELMRNAVAQAPVDTRLRVNFANMLARHHQWGEAKQVLEKLQAEHPGDAAISTLYNKVVVAETKQATTNQLTTP